MTVSQSYASHGAASPGHMSQQAYRSDDESEDDIICTNVRILQQTPQRKLHSPTITPSIIKSFMDKVTKGDLSVI